MSKSNALKLKYVLELGTYKNTYLKCSTVTKIKYILFYGHYS